MAALIMVSLLWIVLFINAVTIQSRQLTEQESHRLKSIYDNIFQGTAIGSTQIALSNLKEADLLNLAKLAQQVERYEDMVKVMYALISLRKGSETADERNMLSISYSHVIGQYWKAWRTVEMAEEKADSITQAAIGNYKETIRHKLTATCTELLKLVNSTLQQCTSEIVIDRQMFYLTMKVDYNRYLVEVASNNTDRRGLIAISRQAYNEGMADAKKLLPATDPIRLQFALSYSVFWYEIMKNPEKAVRIAERAYSYAVSSVEKTNQESTQIIKALRDNIICWTLLLDDY